MKKFLLLICAVLLAFSLASCKNGDNTNEIPDTMEADSYKIAFVTDIGQLKDKSFNQGTWEGVKQYAYANGKSYKYYQPQGGNDATDADRLTAMNAAIAGGAEIIVCAGFMQAVALETAAKANPNVKFVFIDGWAIGLENVTAIIFQEEQAGYLAGYATVKDGYTKLGFAGGGGGTNPACQRFGYGFIQGASAAAKELNVNVEMKYSWNYGSSFSASAELQAMTEGWYSSGTQVVFACGGSMCLSVFQAASANRGKVIGVDVNQALDSSTVITSAMKGLEEGTKHALSQFYNGKWAEIANKLVNLGAKDNAVGLPTDDASWKFTKFTVNEYNELYKKLQNGTINVKVDVDGAETKTYENLTLTWVK